MLFIGHIFILSIEYYIYWILTFCNQKINKMSNITRITSKIKLELKSRQKL